MPLVGHVYSHTHWDRAWYWTFEETRTRLLDLMDDLLELLRRDPRYRHFVLDGQMAMVEDYLSLRPERRAEIRNLASAGRLLLGPFFVLPDLFIPSGESLIRNLERGQRLGRALGPVMSIGYLPDPFGHPAQLPQVLAGFGIRGVLLARGVGDEGERLGADFMWEAPDGSRVHATHQVGGGYCNFAWLGGKVGSWEERVERALELTRRRADEMAPACPHDLLLLCNGCDHLPAQPELPALLDAVNIGQRAVRLRHSTPIAYQAAVRAAIRRGRFAPGLHRGELRGSRYANLLSGVLSARVDLKLAHHQVETELLRWAEPFSALARAHGLGRDDSALLEEAWRLLLLCQPHDDICGCSVDGVHDDDLNRMARAKQLARRISERALQALLHTSSASTDMARGVVVVHPHPWAYRRVLLIPGWRGGARCAEGELPSQRVKGGLLVETPLPPLGWVTLSPSKPATKRHASPVHARASSRRVVRLENTSIVVELGGDGGLKLHHLPSGLRCSFGLIDEGDAGDTYDFSPPERQDVFRAVMRGRPRIIEAGPLRASAELRLDLRLPVALAADRRSRSSRLRRMPARLRVQIEAGSPLCELELVLQNTVDEHRLRAALTLPFKLDSINAGAPFQVMSRSLERSTGADWQQPPSPTVPMHGFAAAESDVGGLAVLAPGLRELEVRSRGGTSQILVTLLRSVRWLSRGDLSSRPGHAGPGLPVEGARQMGPLSVRLGLLPYQGRWTSAGVPRFVEEHANPPLLVPVPDGEFMSAQSFVALEPAGVALTALRAGRNGRLQLRLLNLESCAVDAAVRGALARPHRIRLDGRRLAGRIDLDRIRLRPAELLTLELSVPKRRAAAAARGQARPP